MADHTINCSVSLYKTQIDKVKKYRSKNNKNFKSDASVFQHIIDTFFEDENKKLKTYLMLHIIFPVILSVIAWYSFYSTQQLIDILFLKDIYFNELYIQNRIFAIISFAMLGFLGASFYLFIYRWNKLNG